MRNILLSMALIAAAACETDSYDTGTGKYSYTRADFVEAHTDGKCIIKDVETDDGIRLSLYPEAAPKWTNRPDTVYRALMYYNDKGGGSVEPISISPVPVLTPRPEHEFEDRHTDPVRIESIWLSKSGKYINIGLYLKNGTTDSGSERHTLGMMRETTTVNDDLTRTARLRLYHDQGGVPEYYSSRYYVSIPCDGIDTDSVTISINTYEGMSEHKIKIPDRMK